MIMDRGAIWKLDFVKMTMHSKYDRHVACPFVHA